MTNRTLSPATLSPPKPPKSRRPGRPPHAAWALLLMLLLASVASLSGCDGEAPSAEAPPATRPGAFEATVGGALRDTLAGAASVRLDGDGTLAGLELGPRADTLTPGFSFELSPRTQAEDERVYTVAPREEGGREDISFTLMNAYLRLRDTEFAARAGSLRVARDTSGGWRGTFGLRLYGFVDAASDEAAVVVARGRFGGASPDSNASSGDGRP